MIGWEYDLQFQNKRYLQVKEKLENYFYQDLGFYVLPYMPQKFRNKIVFFPESCDPEKMYKRNIKKIENLKKVWATEEKLFIDQLKVYFSEIDIVKIAISPSLYGPIGTYEIYDTTIQITPRYDRSVEQIQRLIINALTH